MTLEQAINVVVHELKYATSVFSPFSNTHEAYAVLLEEVDELWDAVKVKQDNPLRAAAIKLEAIQVAAMALRILVDLCDG